jgi:DNA-binding winged helix-turn-helix (wHTH) protein
MRIVEFGDFRLDPEAGELRSDGRCVPIQRQPFELLACLIERPGHVFSRHELYRRLWPTGTFVDFEHGLNTVVRKLRRALRDDPDHARYVETIPGRGYRFVAVVRSREAPAGAAETRPGARSHEAMLARPPFVGREDELARLERRHAEARAERGGLVLLAGEPGIGKTRLLAELAARARRSGSLALEGSCAAGGWSPSFAPFTEALAAFARASEAGALLDVADAAVWSVAAKLVPVLRATLPDLPEPPALRPDEERTRLLDALTQVVTGVAKRRCVVLLLDDLHWADAGTLALLGRLAGVARGAAVLIVGAFRDVEVDRGHPLTHLVGQLAREPGFEQITLAGLDARSVLEWIRRVAEAGAAAGLAAAGVHATNGNPLFLRELVIAWAREGRLEEEGAPLRSGETIAAPPRVQAIIEERLAKLSDAARRLLGCASAYAGTFFFEPVARAAELPEDDALDALDEAHHAHLVRSAGGPDDYAFVHALIRHAIYEKLLPSRRMRIHRRLAEEMERQDPADVAMRSAEIAAHYHASRELSGAGAGVPHALAASGRAEAVADFEASARFLRMALDLVGDEDPRRPRVLGRLALALAWSGAADDAVAIASDAGERIAASEGSDAAANYLADAADAVWLRGWDLRAWSLAEQGVRHIGARRDWVWVRLAQHQQMAIEATDPDFPGLMRDTPLRRELFGRILADRHRLSPLEENEIWHTSIFDSRADALARAGDLPAVLVFYAGEYRAGLAGYQRAVEPARGVVAGAVSFHANRSALLCGLGELDAAERSAATAAELARRVGEPSWVFLASGAARGSTALARGLGLGPAADALDAATGPARPPVAAIVPPFQALARHLRALAGDVEKALDGMDLVVRAAERFPPWSPNYAFLVANAAGALWTVGAPDPRTGRLEAQIREKVLKPDFRFPTVDGRLALAWLCALDRRWSEAAHWFACAREVLDEQGARPLLAITDYDEARMYARRGARGDGSRARRLLDAAERQFESIGMLGWTLRAERLRADLPR